MVPRSVFFAAALPVVFVASGQRARADVRVEGAPSAPLRLIYAASRVDWPEPYTQLFTQFDILADDAVCADRVAVHAAFAGDSVWTDYPARRIGNAGPGKGLYRLQYQAKGAYDMKDHLLVVRCGPEGREVWDNNAGRNYRVGAFWGGFLVEGSVYAAGYADAANSYSGLFSSWVTVKTTEGPAPAHVTLSYSTDDGRTWQSAEAHPAVYGEYDFTGAPGFASWSYQVNVGCATSVRYRVAATASDGSRLPSPFEGPFTTRLEPYTCDRSPPP